MKRMMVVSGVVIGVLLCCTVSFVSACDYKCCAPSPGSDEFEECREMMNKGQERFFPNDTKRDYSLILAGRDVKIADIQDDDSDIVTQSQPDPQNMVTTAENSAGEGRDDTQEDAGIVIIETEFEIEYLVEEPTEGDGEDVEVTQIGDIQSSLEKMFPHLKFSTIELDREEIGTIEISQETEFGNVFLIGEDEEEVTINSVEIQGSNITLNNVEVLDEGDVTINHVEIETDTGTLDIQQRSTLHDALILEGRYAPNNIIIQE